MWRHRILLATLAGLVLTPPVLPLEPSHLSRKTLPTWEVAGTTLVLHPDGPFERGFVRVVGPEGYRARKSFSEGTSPAIDLLNDGVRPTNERTPPGHETEEAAQAPLTLLPNGRYRFEAILGGVTGTARIAGSFSASGGTLAPTGSSDPRSPGVPALEPMPESAPPIHASLTEPEELILTDVDNDELTLVELQADNSSNTRLENWQIQNNGGDLRIVEDGPGTQDDPRLTFLQDTSEGRVGLGTTAPETIFHVASGVPAAPKLRIEDNYSGLDGRFDFQVISTLSVGAILRIMDTTGDVVVRIAEGAPTAALSIGPEGVEINADFSVSSSHSAKQNLADIDPATILARLTDLPILEWEYRHSSGTRHVGPMAESFHEAFGLGSNNQSISPLDLGGVALAAIQGLRAELDAERTATAKLLAQKEQQIERLSAEREELGTRLEELEDRIETLFAELEEENL